MLDTFLWAVAALNLAFMAAWLTTGALENVFHPFLNQTYTSQVMDMTLMREEYPDAYAHVAYRRVTAPELRRWAFRFIVAWEVLAMVALWIGAGAAAGAALGLVAVETALVLGLAGATLFCSVWAGFLVAGNWFCYWFGHEGGQNTHFQMLHWGLAGTLLLIGLALRLG
jgi:predicted small integral membrane protein